MPDYTRAQFDPSQFSDAQNKSLAVLSSICGPEVALAFARYYGNNLNPDQVMNVARTYGLWSVQNGMHGPQAQATLLQALGIPASYAPEVNFAAIQDRINSGGVAAVSTPNHYFFLQGYNPATGQYDTGNSGTAYRNGGRYLTADQMRAIGGGSFNGQFLSQGNGQQIQPSPSVANGGVSGPLVTNGSAIDYNNKQQLADYIRYAAAQRGIDPDVALAVAQHEGFNTYTGDNGSSFGPFQLHYGNVATGGNAVAGMGDDFTRRTGLDARDPSTIRQQIDFALDNVSQNGWGAFHGAAAAGYSSRSGIGPGAGPRGISEASSQNQSQYGFPNIYNQTMQPSYRPRNPMEALYGYTPGGAQAMFAPNVVMGNDVFNGANRYQYGNSSGGMQAPIVNETGVNRLIR